MIKKLVNYKMKYFTQTAMGATTSKIAKHFASFLNSTVFQNSSLMRSSSRPLFGRGDVTLTKGKDSPAKILYIFFKEQRTNFKI